MFVTAAVPYRGRFAPSPTGPLHFGSLVAALASCLEARSRGGEWLLRIEDIDTPRNIPGAADAILRTLDACGFAWDGQVLYQSSRLSAYEAALDMLRRRGLLYPCACSRSDIAARASRTAIDGGLLYPGSCRDGLAPGVEVRAWRLRVDDTPLGFEDRLQGVVEQRLAEQVGDFVLRRADGIHAYQLAVVVDDACQGITDIVRGADLLASTPRQLWLQQCLAYPRPSYAHLPVATNPAGEKWSKQTLAPALVAGKAAAELVRALRFLGQPAPAELAVAKVAEVWDWALVNWSFATIPRVPAISVPATAA
ncbi:tRNA glutamyl-Q(34) synthetase GluQRS [Azonexus caeni]|jgi:glutamyl-Q tRNA(Asp) synthetase|uniref:tRNA glutamyl-Q(34) synthetase GluQRS n=1 Tax=Azonexus caeni TaxID=266126 RepID=UPI003A84C4D1